jgi:multimeric flavodoxin WrbA
MKILAIMGSPRKKGNTYKLTRRVEECMKQLGNVEFEYIFLKDLDLKICRGCGICFEKGEELCPLKDDRAMLEEKMYNADGVIFTSPNYVFNVSGLMKNFIDRFAYACHRPRFFKSAMVLTTSGIGGSRLMLLPFSIAPQTWGFKVVHSFGIISNDIPEYSTPQKKADRKINKAAKKFHDALASGRPRPSILTMAMFLAIKSGFKNLNPEYFDYQYWKNQGWLENSASYYYDPETNFIRKGLTRILSKFMGLVT